MARSRGTRLEKPLANGARSCLLHMTVSFVVLRACLYIGPSAMLCQLLDVQCRSVDEHDCLVPYQCVTGAVFT